MGQEFLNIMDPEDVKKIIKNIPINKRVENVSLEDSFNTDSCRGCSCNHKPPTI